ncbi:MAG: Stage 0 sporulation A-like protein [Lachnoclostridium sp.]|jgi:DNA-binding LytR/AlgR family response regulator
MIVQIAVCDDEMIFLENFIQQITTQFLKADMEICVKSYTNGTSLLEECRKIPFDVLFLDIEMPDISGIEIAETIRAVNPFVNIIFVTNQDDMVFQSIHYKPFRFLRKRYLEDELPEAIHALAKKIRSENQYYTIKFNNSFKQIRITDIIYLESYKHDIFLYTKDEKYRIRSKMERMEKELEVYGFIRVHSGFLVNYRYIYSIDKTKIVLSNKKIIPVSRYRLKNVKQKLQLYSRGT